jgi:hypothetical protein
VRGKTTIVLVVLTAGTLAAAPPIPPLPRVLSDLLGPPATPPMASTSHYMQTADPDVAYDMGCEMGRGADAGTQPKQALVVLAFGMPVRFGEGTHGASLFSGRDQRTTEIRIAAQEMAHGFWACSLGLGPKLTIAIGTSNYGRHVTYSHGQAWGGMVNRANEIIRQRGWNLQAAIEGASDIELSWSSPAAAGRWVDGYADATEHALINFGDAAGCPPAGSSCGTAAHPEWEQSDVWNLAWGHSPAVPLPEIYLNSGVMAEQWHQVARFGVRRHASLMRFSGSMTQYAACREVGCDRSTDNTPAEGWTQLYEALNSGDGTEQTPRFSTDISWSTDVPGSGSVGRRLPGDVVWPTGIQSDGEFPSAGYVFVNRWTGMLGGRHVLVYAGSAAQEPATGLILAMSLSLDLQSVRAVAYPIAPLAGLVRIVSAHGMNLELRGEDGTRFSFDLRTGRLA